MWLILCSSDDAPALWAATRLRARGLDPLVILTPELLQYGTRWEHRVGSRAPSSVALTLADGRRIESRDIHGVLNRITVLPSYLVEAFHEDDRAYALQEWTALHISWMSCLTVPVLNRPVMQGLCGAWRHLSEWTWLAHRAGLETFSCAQGSPLPPERASQPHSVAPARTIFIIDGEPIEDDLPAEVGRACGRLGTLTGTRLIGVDLETDGWRFLGASPRPDLRLGGEAIVGALMSTLGGI